MERGGVASDEGRENEAEGKYASDTTGYQRPARIATAIYLSANYGRLLLSLRLPFFSPFFLPSSRTPVSLLPTLYTRPVLFLPSFPFADTLRRSTINYLGRCTGRCEHDLLGMHLRAGTIPVDRKSRPGESRVPTARHLSRLIRLEFECPATIPTLGPPESRFEPRVVSFNPAVETLLAAASHRKK